MTLDWAYGDSNLVYDPSYPPEALARCPGVVVYRNGRCYVDAAAVARLSSIDAAAAIGDSSYATTAEAVEPESEEEPGYVLVGTAEEVEREERVEAEVENAWAMRVRQIEELLDEVDEDEDLAARIAGLFDDSLLVNWNADRLAEEEEEEEAGWDIIVVAESDELRVIRDGEAAVPETTAEAGCRHEDTEN